MSRPSSQPENTAPPAPPPPLPVSAVAPPADDAVSAGTSQGSPGRGGHGVSVPETGPGPEPETGGTGTGVIIDSAASEVLPEALPVLASADAAPSSLPAQQQSERAITTEGPTSAQAQTPEQQTQAAANAADQSIKKLRGPILHRPSAGPSLLTQALASARGILPASATPAAQQPDPNSRTNSHPKPHNTHIHSTHGTQTASNDLPPHDSSDSQPPKPALATRQTTRTVPNPNAPKDVRSGASSPSEGGGSLTSPGLSPRSQAMASSAVMTATHASSSTLPSPSNLSFANLDATGLDASGADGADPRLRAYNGPPRQPTDRGVPTDKPDLGSGPTYRGSRATGHSPGLVAAGESTLGTPTPRPHPLEQRVSLGPEKIWSIHSAESDGSQDGGKVEKSVQEVLAGVEHNTRSRKASHSLRFFKEGLPEEKTKRRDSRHPGAVRESALSPALEAVPSASYAIIEDDSPHAPIQQSPRLIESQPTLNDPWKQPSTSDAPGQPSDYFGDVAPTETTPRLSSQADQGRPRSVCLDDYSALPEPAIAVSDQDSQGRRHSGDSTECADSGEEGEYSGEEKISSAVFVPHQSPPESQGTAPQTPSNLLKRSASTHRGVSRGGDWLVKADEPEADRQEDDADEEDDNEESHYDATHPRRDGTAEVVGAEISNMEQTPRLTARDDVPPPHVPSLDSRAPPAVSPLLMHQHQHQQQPLLQHPQTFPLNQDEEQAALPKQPLEAIELIPYKHQVGGHTTLWRFSKRAVCKQLNNRENEFYERIERDVRDLLAFLPRYIGVLNVTFHKQPRRKSTLKREDAAGLERKHVDQTELSVALKGKGTAVQHDEAVSRPAAEVGAEGAKAASSAAGGPSHHRVISQSLQSSQIPVPTVTFVDNQHILPRHLLQPSPKPLPFGLGGTAARGGGGSVGGSWGASLHGPGRFRSSSATTTAADGGGAHAGATGASKKTLLTRPTLHNHHANSWGATTVNKRLRNEVFNDAFLKQPFPMRPNRRAHQRASLQHSFLRPTTSDSQLVGDDEGGSARRGYVDRADSEPDQPGHRYHHSAPTPQDQSASDSSASKSLSGLGHRMKSLSDSGPEMGNGRYQQHDLPRQGRDRRAGSRSGDAAAGSSGDDNTKNEDVPKDVTGTSAPEPEILGDKLPPQAHRRRYSGTALRRKPKSVSESRGELQYFQEPDDMADFKRDAPDDGDAKEVAGAKLESSGQGNGHATAGSSRHHPPSPLKLEEPQDAKALTVLGGGGGDGRGGGFGTSSNYASAATSGSTSPTAEFKRIPRPINPKEAQTQRDSRVEYFLLLEDLTAGMKRPCIMDLKMGTRQYGVEAGPKKQKSQQRKCAETTSRDLGVRVCGLQVWDVATQTYIFKDKYYGRRIKAGAEFQGALRRFLYDGVDPASILRHIPTVLQKLRRLEVIIRRLDGYRFYAASLLMFYDGDPGVDASGNDTVIDDSTTDFATDTEEGGGHHYHHNGTATANGGGGGGARRKRNKREIDFKMADFANSVTAGGGDGKKPPPCPPQHPDGPDRGFLRGLKTLRHYFLQIQRETREELGLFPTGAAYRNTNGGGVDHQFEDESEDDEGFVSE